MKNNKTLDHFQASIFAGSQTTGETVMDFSGNGQQWQEYLTIKVPGFDGSQTVTLNDFWLEVFSHQSSKITAKLTGLETITKFGNSQQIKMPFTIIAHLTYTDVDG